MLPDNVLFTNIVRLKDSNGQIDFPTEVRLGSNRVMY